MPISDTFMTPHTYQGDIAEVADGTLVPLRHVFSHGPITTIHRNVHYGRLSSSNDLEFTPWIMGSSEEDLVEALVALYDDYELG